MITPELQHKIDAAIHLLQSVQASHPNEQIEIAYSGGKDSDVILQLAKEARINYRAIYKNTTIDPPYTIKHCKEMGVEIVQPKLNFFQLIEKQGLPSRFRRHCCSTLKEYKILDIAVLGIRREESTKRSARYKEPIICHFYRSKSNKAQHVLPILYWTIDDVKNFIIDRNIQLAQHYYDKDGTLHIDRRLGCVCCPLKNKKHRIQDFKEHPNMVKAYIRAAQKYYNKHPFTSKVVNDVYKLFVCDVFYGSYKQFAEIMSNRLFGHEQDIDCKDFIENYFELKL